MATNHYLSGGGSSGTYSIQTTLTTDGVASGWSYEIPVDCSSNNVQVTLPTSATGTSKGQSIIIKRLDNSNNVCTIVPSSVTEKIDNITNNKIYIYGQNDSIQFTSQGNGDCKILSDNRNSTGNAISFLRVMNTTGQSTNLTANNALIFNTVEILQGNGISFNSSTNAFTLSPNKTYKLTACIPKINLSSGGYCYTRWYNDTTSSFVGSGSGGDSITSTSNTMSGCITTCTITPSVLTTLRCLISGLSSVTSIGDNGNIIWAEVEEISRQATVINTVDTMFLKRTTDTTALLVNNDITWDSTIGNMIYSSPYVTLLAGKTYNISWALAFNGNTTAGEVTVNLVDNTNITIPTQESAHVFSPSAATSSGGAGVGFCQITPTINTQVKLRLTTMSGGISTAVFRGDGTWLNITQIGSTACISVPQSIIESIDLTTGEQIVYGKKINGSQLYAKRITGTTPTSGTGSVVFTPSTGISSRLIDVKGWVARSGQPQRHLVQDVTVDSTLAHASMFWQSTADGSINIYMNNSNYWGVTYDVIIYYTK